MAAVLTVSSPGAMAARRRQVLAASVGNVIEWYDWFIYSLLSVYFAGQFFPSTTDISLVPLLAALAVFAVGFVMRPLGGLVFGSLADRMGRKRALTLTVTGIGLGSALIATSPTFNVAGVLAPVLLVFARMIQGLSAGGEYAAAASYLVEAAPSRLRGTFSSLFFVSMIVGNLLAIFVVTGLQSVLGHDQMSAWGWRIPFAIGAVIAFFGLWVRRRVDETYTHAEEFAKDISKRPNPFEFLRTHPVQALKVVFITAGGTVAYYVFTVYMPTYASIAVGFDLGQALTVSIIALFYFLLLQPIMGWISDRVGRKPLLVTFGVAFTFGCVPLMSLLTDSFWSLLLVQCVGLTFIAAWSACVNAVFCELYPSRVRATGMGVPYALAVALFGGTAPYLGTWFVDQNLVEYFPWYISAVTLASTLTFLTLKETAHKPLPQ